MKEEVGSFYENGIRFVYNQGYFHSRNNVDQYIRIRRFNERGIHYRVKENGGYWFIYTEEGRE